MRHITVPCLRSGSALGARYPLPTVEKRNWFPSPKPMVPVSRKLVSPVKVTSDSNVAASPDAGPSVPVSPSAPTVLDRVLLGALVVALRTLPTAPTGSAWPLNCSAYMISRIRFLLLPATADQSVPRRGCQGMETACL